LDQLDPVANWMLYVTLSNEELRMAEEFANLACLLASEQGSYITGTAINVDGGRSPVV